ncbi:PIN domain-containing protein [Mucilaginibacter sp. BJC16-A38]|uniref:type II toxin-antitoxin system VapC family toxin n=1 Tax=Mucilaginibacter phenanthrenivorans TaxID=1234842 RepID=UPI00215829DE|nr:PIN domain-containing protein [Mucilaginibacter phenanthrenivorans]MCR8561873.1 PIN domain-containing protein [Mucilaginibacter phenanthrenivorans]
MDIILVDTSVWVNFFKAKETEASLFLKYNLANIIIATCPVIVQEVLQGINSDKEFEKVNSYLNTLTKFTGNGYELAYEAANLYRQLRINGITIRKPNDCLIAMFAIKNDVMLLNDDRDFRFIAKYSPLKIYEPE